MGGAI